MDCSIVHGAMMAFTRMRFLFLTVFSHVMLFVQLFLGTVQTWSVTIGIAFIMGVISTMFYHRLLSHRSWHFKPWFERAGVLLGAFTLTGTPLTRTAVHRMHHKYADTLKDPHSPKYTSLVEMYLPQLRETKLEMILVRDVLSDPFLMWVHKQYLLLLAVLALILPVQWTMIWGSAAALLWFNIFLCNVFCHKTGEAQDSHWLGAFTFGEGYHKHHHDHPNDPRFGPIDAGYLLIGFLR